MAAGKYSFTVQQGSTLRFRIDYKDSNNLPVDLTGYQSRMIIRPDVASSTVICSLSSVTTDVDGSGLNMTPVISGVTYPKSSGSIEITISAASSSLFTFGEAVYDLEIYSGSAPSTYVDRILEGRVKLTKEVTR
jgi:hypothetical protein